MKNLKYEKCAINIKYWMVLLVSPQNNVDYRTTPVSVTSCANLEKAFLRRERY